MLASFIGEDLVVLSLYEVTDDRLHPNFVYSLSCKLCDRKSADCVTCNEPCGNAIKYDPTKGFVDKTFTVVTGLKDDVHGIGLVYA